MKNAFDILKENGIKNYSSRGLKYKSMVVVSRGKDEYDERVYLINLDTNEIETTICIDDRVLKIYGSKYEEIYEDGFVPSEKIKNNKKSKTKTDSTLSDEPQIIDDFD